MKNLAHLMPLLLLAALCGAASGQVVLTPGNNYVEDFESGPGAWTADASAVWEHGVPSASTIDTAASGINVFATDLDADYPNSANAWIEASFDVTAFSSDPLFAMNLWYDSENTWDGVTVELDTGSGFNVVGAIGDNPTWFEDTDVDGLGNDVDGWSGASNGYVNAVHRLDGAAGNVVTVRIRFGSGFSGVIGNGAAVDDIRIVDAAFLTTGYSEDFETGPGVWRPTSNSGSNFQHGVPNGLGIDSAASGMRAFATDLLSQYANNTDTYIEATFESLSITAFDPIFRMSLWYETEAAWDGVSVSIDIGSTGNFETLGAVGDPTWFNDTDVDGIGNGVDGWSGDSGGYITVGHVLDGVAGSGLFTLRILFGSDGSLQGGDGCAVDDIEIVDQVATFPGTNEDFFTRYAIGSGPFETPLNTLNDVISIAPGTLVSIGHDSMGTWQGVGELLVFASLGATGAAPLTILPNFYLGMDAVFALSNPIFGLAQLPFGGFNYAITHPGGMASGTTVYTQGVIIDSSAANSNYATTGLLSINLN